jgi:hypothetical protein
MKRHVAKLIMLASSAMLGACAPGPSEQLYGTPQQFMATEIQPTAEIYWGAVGFTSELIDGVVVERDFRPETAEDWQKVADSAVKLREFGEVLASPAYAQGRGPAWLDFAQGLQDVSRQAEQAAIDQDTDAVFEVGGTLYNVCSACHQAYPPAEPEPEPEPALPQSLG